jgi:hypothetical protein
VAAGPQALAPEQRPTWSQHADCFVPARRPCPLVPVDRIPEVREAFGEIGQFFDKHLKK